MLESLFPISKYWDTYTFLFYLLVSMVVALLCHKGAKYKAHCIDKSDYRHKLSKFCYFLAYIILVIIATVRNEYVGSDTPIYVKDFLAATKYQFNIGNLLSFNQSEPGFQLLLFAIRSFTSDYHVFFFVCYSFIAASYIKYIKYYYDDTSDYIFLLIFIFFYVSNMSGLRSAFGMVFLLLSFIALSEKKYRKSIILTLVASCFHYTMFFNIIVIILTWVVSSPIIKTKRWILPTAIVLAMILSYAMVNGLNRLFSFTKYAFYKTSIEELSLLGSSFFILFGFLIFLNYKRLRMRLEKKDALEAILYLCISFLITYPVIYLTAAYRIPNYYALPRLTIWSEIEKCYENRVTKNSIKVFRLICFLIVILYLLFRFTRVAENGNFMYQV